MAGLNSAVCATVDIATATAAAAAAAAAGGGAGWDAALRVLRGGGTITVEDVGFSSAAAIHVNNLCA